MSFERFDLSETVITVLARNESQIRSYMELVMPLGLQDPDAIDRRQAPLFDSERDWLSEMPRERGVLLPVGRRLSWSDFGSATPTSTIGGAAWIGSGLRVRPTWRL